MLSNIGPHVALSGIVLLFVACSGGPSVPDRIDVSPRSADFQAFADYDANGDGELDATELEKCPALKVALSRCDKDGDGRLAPGEIADRIRDHQSADATIISGSVEITLDGAPLEGATVTFEPETFMGDMLRPVSATTNADGRGYLEGQNAEFPGIYLGFYRVRISKLYQGKETIPSKYNSATELGYEATDDIDGIQNVIEFKLVSK